MLADRSIPKGQNIYMACDRDSIPLGACEVSCMSAAGNLEVPR